MEDENLFATLAREQNWNLEQPETIGQRFLLGSNAAATNNLPTPQADLQSVFNPQFLHGQASRLYQEPFQPIVPASFPQNSMLSNPNNMHRNSQTNPIQIPSEVLLSASGFDVLGALIKMGTREDPKIQLGPIDMSCAFLVSDLRLPDIPIVYVSPSFEEMTGYANEEIIGRNCRFLQDPNGQTYPGSNRIFTDHTVVQRMKQCVEERSEGQFTLVNYKKSGEPFLNYLTMIPIAFGEDPNSKVKTHFIGLQVDLIAQPQAILKRLNNGTYSVNYSFNRNLKASVSNDDFREELFESSISESNSYVQVPFVLKNISENFPDLIFILSLRGLFLSISDAPARKLLEWSADELIGEKLADYVHPSDFVAVIRDLKTCSNTGKANIICRIKKKRSGYFYFELNAHVYTGSKRNRCFIVSARELYIPQVPFSLFYEPELNRKNETWLRLSLEGLILYSTSSCVNFFGIPAEKINVHSLFEFLPSEMHEMVSVALEARQNQTIQLQIQHLQYNNFCLANFMYISDPIRQYYLVQIKKNYQNLVPISNTSSLYEMVQGSSSSSIYYELNKLRVSNLNLKEELNFIKN